jgi:hypothetical protein
LAARPADFFRPADRSLAHGWWALPPHTSERRLFPGFVVFAGVLAAIRLAAVRKPQDSVSLFQPRLWLVVTALSILPCFVSGAGVPILDQMRVPARWMLPALLGLAVLTGWSWTRIFSPRHVPALRAARMIAFGFLLLESLTLPMRPPGVPSQPDDVFVWLSEQPFAPILEWPLAPPDDNSSLLHATWHRQPFVNGSNGYFPPGFARTMAELEDFPSPASLERLRTMRVRYVVIGTKKISPSGQSWNDGRRQSWIELEGEASLKAWDRHLVADLGRPGP